MANFRLDRDKNSGRVLLSRGLKSVGIIDSACRGLEVTQPLKQETFEVKYKQLSLF